MGNLGPACKKIDGTAEFLIWLINSLLLTSQFANAGGLTDMLILFHHYILAELLINNGFAGQKSGLHSFFFFPWLLNFKKWIEFRRSALLSENYHSQEVIINGSQLISLSRGFPSVAFLDYAIRQVLTMACWVVLPVAASIGYSFVQAHEHFPQKGEHRKRLADERDRWPSCLCLLWKSCLL